MSLWRRLSKLPRSVGVTRCLIQAFHRPALTGQHDTLVPSEEGKHAYQSPPGQSWPECMGKTELLPTQQGREGRLSTLPKKISPGTMSRSLVKKVMGLSDVKEDVYGALDEWAAFELEFPVTATRMALEKLRRLEQWHRVIQVTKWMFSKGIGKTHSSYGLLLKAYCKEGRFEEAEEVWNGLLVSLNRSMPKLLFAFMSNAYRRREMPEKVIQVFEQMESFGIKPDRDILRRVEEAYQQLNMQDMVEQIGKKYAIDSRTRRNERRLKERKAKQAVEQEQWTNKQDKSDSSLSKTEEDEDGAQDKRAASEAEHLANKEDEDCGLQYLTDDSEGDSQQEVTKAHQKEGRASLGTGKKPTQEEKPIHLKPLEKLKVESSSTSAATDVEGVRQMRIGCRVQKENSSHMTTTVEGKKPTREVKPGRLKNSKKEKITDSLSTSTAKDEEFVKQIIDTM